MFWNLSDFNFQVVFWNLSDFFSTSVKSDRFQDRQKMAPFLHCRYFLICRIFDVVKVFVGFETCLNYCFPFETCLNWKMLKNMRSTPLHEMAMFCFPTCRTYTDMRYANIRQYKNCAIMKKRGKIVNLLTEGALSHTLKRGVYRIFLLKRELFRIL